MQQITNWTQTHHRSFYVFSVSFELQTSFTRWSHVVFVTNKSWFLMFQINSFSHNREEESCFALWACVLWHWNQILCDRSSRYANRRIYITQRLGVLYIDNRFIQTYNTFNNFLILGFFFKVIIMLWIYYKFCMMK